MRKRILLITQDPEIVESYLRKLCGDGSVLIDVAADWCVVEAALKSEDSPGYDWFILGKTDRVSMPNLVYMLNEEEDERAEYVPNYILLHDPDDDWNVEWQEKLLGINEALSATFRLPCAWDEPADLLRNLIESAELP